MSDSTKTPISQLGEFGLIERLQSQIGQRTASTQLGIGDDAAVIQKNEGESFLVSSDMLVEGVHFDLRYFPLMHLGYKAAAANFSDIAAMNGIPSQLIVNLGLSSKFTVEAVEAIYQGLEQACQDFGADLAGGDTTTTRSGLVISATAVGQQQTDKIAYRSGAQVGDALCVTGDLGGAYFGLQILEREKEVLMTDPNMWPKLEKYEYMLQRFLKPKARTDFIHELAEAGVVPHAMIDISDGLASELIHIGRSSEVGCKVFESQIPLEQPVYDTAVEFDIPPTTAAMNGGEDFELLLAISPEQLEQLRHLPDLAPIGIVSEAANGYQLVTRGDQMVEIQAQGWAHF